LEENKSINDDKGNEIAIMPKSAFKNVASAHHIIGLQNPDDLLTQYSLLFLINL